MIAGDPEGSGGSPPEPLLIPADLLDAMVAHCRREAPNECCGILGGLPPRTFLVYPSGERGPGLAAGPGPGRRIEIDAIKGTRPLDPIGEVVPETPIRPRWLPPRATKLYPLRNTAESSETRYDADPREIIDTVRDLRRRFEMFVAIYHSHPRWQAVPSRADLDLNHYGALPRIIVSLLEEPPVVRIWRLDKDSFEELPWRAVPVDPSPSGG